MTDPPEGDRPGPGEWAAACEEHRPPRFDPAAHRRVVVVSAHPDDETIGAGGILQALRAAGADLTVVVATDGEAAYPGLDADARQQLASRRRAELVDALGTLGLDGIPVHWLGLPDSDLAAHGPALRAALAPLLEGADAYLAPWPSDPHPDHRAAGLAAAAAAPARVHGWSYPVWAWAWTRPDDPAVPWDRAQVFPLDAAGRRVRRRAVDCFASQTGPGPDGSEPVLAAGLLDHLDRGADLLFREPRSDSAPVERFATLYADGGDPWRSESWYERRKRAVVLASLPRERYRRAFEPGCGTGELTVDLAARCDEVVASDPVPDAVQRARRAVGRRPGVSVAEAALPTAVPDRPIDLALCSEVLYYLSDSALAATLDRLVEVLVSGGDLVTAHWRGWPAEAPRDAAATHRVLRGHPELDELVEHTDEQFLLHVLRRR